MGLGDSLRPADGGGWIPLLYGPLAAATLSVLAGLFLMIQGVVSIAFGCLSGRFWM